MALRWGTMLDPELIIQEEVETKHARIENVIRVLPACDAWIEGYGAEETAMDHHAASKCEWCQLQPWFARDDLVESFSFAPKAIPIGHPMDLFRNIIVVCAFRIEVIPGDTIDGLPHEAAANIFNRLIHEQRIIKTFVIIDQNGNFCT